jgi:MFS family permease
MLSSLRTRNYRLFFFGQLVSVSGTWMQTVAQSFLVLDMTHSGTALGLTIGARFAPILILGPLGGLIADRMDNRRLLYVTQALSGGLALAFGLLISTHAIHLWSVFVLASLLGLVNVVDNPARQSIIPELVARDQLPNAVLLNSVTINLSRILGAALGGTLVAKLSLALCFDLNALSFVAVLVTLAMMSGADISRPVPEAREPGQVRAGLRYVGSTPELLIPLIMIAVVGTLAWEFQVSLPLLAQGTFHGNAATYGTMTAAMGAGAVVGGLISASRARARRARLALAAIGWGAALTLAALAPTLPVEYALLVLVGYGTITFNAYAKTSLQLAATPAMRGRVMALWALAWNGSTPIGGPIIGWIGEQVGPRWGLLVGGVPTLLLGLGTLVPLARIEDRAMANADGGTKPLPRVTVIPNRGP